MLRFTRLAFLLVVLPLAMVRAQPQGSLGNPNTSERNVATGNPLRQSTATDANSQTPRNFVEPTPPVVVDQFVKPAPLGDSPVQALSGPDAPAETAKPGITAEIVQQKLHTLDENKDLPDEAKAELAKRYNKALEWLNTAQESAKKASIYDAEIRQGDALIARAKEQLAASMPDPVPDVPESATVSQLEQKLSEVEAVLKSAQNDLAKRDDEIKRRTERTTDLAKLIADAKQRLDETQKSGKVAPGDVDLASESKQLENTARLLALEQQLSLLQTESRRYEALAELFPLQRDVAKRVVAFREKEVAAWHKLVALRRKQETERQAREARRQVERAHPALRSLAERNAVLAEMRQTLTGSIDRIEKERKTLEQQIKHLKEEHDKITEKVTRAGHSTTVGLMLRKMRDDVPNRQNCENPLRFIQREMPTVNLRLMELQEERSTLGDMESLAKQVVADLDASINRFDADYVNRMVMELLQTKRDLLQRVITDQDTYLKDLSELELANQTLVKHIDQLTDYVDEHVLWIRSNEPVSVAEVRALLPAMTVLANPQDWIGVISQTGADALRRPYYATIVALIGIVLFALQRRLSGRLKAICEEATRQGQLRFLPTLEGLLVSTLLSAQCPTLMLYVGWRLAVSDTSTDFSQAVAVALMNVAVFLWAAEWIRQIMRPKGVAEAYFAWPAITLRGVRRHLRWLTLLGLPLAFVCSLCLGFEDRQWSGSVARVAFILGMLLVAGFFHALFYPQGRMFREMQVANPNGWLIRFRHLVYGASALSPLALAMLAAIGYFYSAQQLALRIQYTVTVMVALALAHAVLSRWFLVKRRNLAIEQSRQRRADAQDASATDGTQQAPSPPERDLSAIHEQLRYLLRYAVIGCILVAGWLIWSDVLPALRVFDRAIIWNNKVEITETIEGANGKMVADTYEKEVPTTLRHAMSAILLILVTYLVGRNLPALLEITLLDRLPIDTGGRHAVSMLVHYAVTLTGVVLACKTMSISWSSVQWLAAAMTVGLGFGLQEIFGNLVSGLIILFERPIRVGDIVTVGTETGTISQMRMRATTITDYDRRELIVPNKKFITDNVINWTLSDPISRVVIPVGIAYGSDTALAHRLLIQVAREHPIVLDEPEPSALFKGFGDSTLNFNLRVFIPNRDVYIVVLHELNTAIDRAFREANIEIAFPQRDLHVRSISQIIPFHQETVSQRADAA